MVHGLNFNIFQIADLARNILLDVLSHFTTKLFYCIYVCVCVCVCVF